MKIKHGPLSFIRKETKKNCSSTTLKLNRFSSSQIVLLKKNIAYYRVKRNQNTRNIKTNNFFFQNSSIFTFSLLLLMDVANQHYLLAHLNAFYNFEWVLHLAARNALSIFFGQQFFFQLFRWIHVTTFMIFASRKEYLERKI